MVKVMHSQPDDIVYWVFFHCDSPASSCSSYIRPRLGVSAPCRSNTLQLGHSFNGHRG